MSARTHFSLGIALVVIAAFAAEFFIAGGLFWLLLTAALALVVAIGGRRIPLLVRVVATGFTLYLGYQMCLIGRTMEPFLSGYTFRMALLHFGLCATLPTIALLRCWEGRVGVYVCLLMLPITFTAACIVASYEESQFIARHSGGVGPTARWTVTHHWLEYDAATKRLNGSD